MSDPLFLIDTLADPLPPFGARVTLDGPEGRHAAVVRRLGPGESVIVSDGRGRGVRGTVREASKAGLTVEVTEPLTVAAPRLRYVAVQALAKGDRAELAAEMLTEIGASEIVPWQASRSVARWNPERATKGVAKWRSVVREAAKQSRRLRVPAVAGLASTADVVSRIEAAQAALVLDSAAARPLAEVALPDAGDVLVIIGPEGGITPDELTAFATAGAQPVSIGDGVLRTSTAGVVALAGLMLRTPGPR